VRGARRPGGARPWRAKPMDAVTVDGPSRGTEGSKPSRGRLNPEDGRCRGMEPPGTTGSSAPSCVVGRKTQESRSSCLRTTGRGACGLTLQRRAKRRNGVGAREIARLGAAAGKTPGRANRGGGARNRIGATDTGADGGARVDVKGVRLSGGDVRPPVAWARKTLDGPRRLHPRRLFRIALTVRRGHGEPPPTWPRP
jgi:hypothetical protein